MLGCNILIELVDELCNSDKSSTYTEFIHFVDLKRIKVVFRLCGKTHILQKKLTSRSEKILSGLL